MIKKIIVLVLLISVFCSIVYAVDTVTDIDSINPYRNSIAPVEPTKTPKQQTTDIDNINPYSDNYINIEIEVIPLPKPEPDNINPYSP